MTRRSTPRAILVVSESFLPQVNGVTNSVRRVLEHLAGGHEAELVAPTGRRVVRRLPGAHHPRASLPFYRDFRLGLETRPGCARRAAVPPRRGPHRLAGHARHCRPRARPRARHPERGDLPDRPDRLRRAVRQARARCRRRPRDGLPDPQDPHPRRPDPGAVDGQRPPARGPRRSGELALWPRGVDLDAFHPGLRDEGLRRQLAPDGRILVGYVGRLAPEKELELLTYLLRRPPLRAGGRRRRARGGATPAADAGRHASSVSCTAPSSAARTPPSTCSCTPVGTRPTASPPRRRSPPASPSSPRAPAARSTSCTTAWPASSTSPATATTSAATSTGSPATRSSAAGWGSPRAVGRGPLLAGGQRGARRALPRRRGDHDLATASWPPEPTVGGLVDVVDEVDAVLHRAAAGQRRGAAARRAGSRSSTPADQHHLGDRGLVGVVVLAGVLEDLLDGAAGAGQEDDAGVADLEEDRLAGGVAEVLRDAGGEDVRRLVAVVPGRDRRASRAAR